MERFIGFVTKEFYHIFRDKRTLLILFGIPIVQILLFGFAITNEIKDVRIAILDHSKDVATRQLTNKILSSGYFQVQANLQTAEEIEDGFRKGLVKQALVFEPNFAQNLQGRGQAHIQIIGDASDPNTSNTLLSYTSAIIQNFQRESGLSSDQPMQVRTEVRMVYNAELKSVYMFVPGVITLILMLVSAMMTSVSIAREKETGTMEILMVSPLKPLQIIAGKVLPYLLLSFLNAVVILVLATFVFDMPIRGSLILLLAECVLFIATALALGILISTLTSSQQVAMMISLAGLMLPTMLLSGFIFPIESMPKPLQWFSQIIPAKWFIHLIKDLMIKGVGFSYVWKDTLVLVAMALFFIGVSSKKFKLRLQ